MTLSMTLSNLKSHLSYFKPLYIASFSKR